MPAQPAKINPNKADQNKVQVPVPPREKQLVAPSENTDEPTLDTRLKSDHASKADIQKIKRGEGESLPPPSPPKTAPAKAEEKPQPAQKSKSATHGADESAPAKRPSGPPLLKLSDDQVMASLESADSAASRSGRKASGAEKSSPEEEDKQRALRFRQSTPFARSMLSALKVGTPDYLPEVQDGDVTLLNAKADHFAVFVRRVALQVFGSIRSTGWQELHYSEVQRIHEFATIEAVMSLKGKLVEVKILDTSGSTIFDSLTKRSAEIGTWDQNPPSDAAADDHKIHFIFKARSWTRQGSNGGEQRWLLLGTGLL